MMKDRGDQPVDARPSSASGKKVVVHTSSSRAVLPLPPQSSDADATKTHDESGPVTSSGISPLPAATLEAETNAATSRTCVHSAAEEDAPSAVIAEMLHGCSSGPASPEPLTNGDHREQQNPLPVLSSPQQHQQQQHQQQGQREVKKSEEPLSITRETTLCSSSSFPPPPPTLPVQASPLQRPVARSSRNASFAANTNLTPATAATSAPSSSSLSGPAAAQRPAAFGGVTAESQRVPRGVTSRTNSSNRIHTSSFSTTTRPVRHHLHGFSQASTSPTMRHTAATVFPVSTSASLAVTSQQQQQQRSVKHSHSKVLSASYRSPSFSQQLYRLLRLCFLRRWTWHMWQVCVRVYGGRRLTRSGDESAEEEEEFYGDDDDVQSAYVEEEEEGSISDVEYNYTDVYTLDEMDRLARTETRRPRRPVELELAITGFAVHGGEEEEEEEGVHGNGGLNRERNDDADDVAEGEHDEEVLSYDRGGSSGVGGGGEADSLFGAGGSAESTAERLLRSGLEGRVEVPEEGGTAATTAAATAPTQEPRRRLGTVHHTEQPAASLHVGSALGQQPARSRRTNRASSAGRSAAGGAGIGATAARGSQATSTGSRGGGGHTSHRVAWSLADMCRLFFTFFFCCCCCLCCPPRGNSRDLLRSTQCRYRWVSRLVYLARVMWMRHRCLCGCLAALLCVFLWFVVLPIAAVVGTALMENEEVFVSRMMVLGLPREVAAHPGPTAVMVQVPGPLQLRDVDGPSRGKPPHDALAALAAAQVRQLMLHTTQLSFAQRYLAFPVPLLRRNLKLNPSQLPSWTLYAVEKACEECIEDAGYSAAFAMSSAAGAATSSPAEAAPARPTVQPQPQPSFSPLMLPFSALPAIPRGVFVTTDALLGKIGPMLLAIASVTDDIAVEAEISQWRWLPQPTQQATVMRGLRSGTAPRHVAVLGIPSTDEPARAALRQAQRQTWLSYHDVAQHGNEFRGSLLVLYVFAASERPRVRSSPQPAPPGPSSPANAKLQEKKGGGELPAAGPLFGYVSSDTQRLREDASMLLPTFSDLTRAAQHRVLQPLVRPVAAAAAAEAAPSTAATTPLSDKAAEELLSPYLRRRMRLRANWRNGDVADSPCEQVEEYPVEVRHPVTGNITDVQFFLLENITSFLGLPVTPLYTTPAQLVCHASTALWQEALTHRNVLWVDMMTDRKPRHSLKKLGDTSKWDLPVEVGMSQKLILWLSYAFHAFPDVPFLLKGDDDTYLKVPQYLNDIYYLHRGRSSGRALEQLTQPASADADKDTPHWMRRVLSKSTTPSPTKENYLLVRATEECLYWGSLRRWNGEMYFSAGMLTLLHRRLVQAVLEGRPEFNNDAVRLSTRPYSPLSAHSYYAAMMDHEDVMLGKLLAERRMRTLQLCPYYRSWYIWEPFDRFHDVRRGRMRNVTWSTVAAHRSTPADMHYFHYFFQEEYKYGRDRTDTTKTKQKTKEEAAAEGGGDDARVDRRQLEDVQARQRARAWLEAQQQQRFGHVLAEPPAVQAEKGHTNLQNARGGVGLSGVLSGVEQQWSMRGLPDVLWSPPREMNHTPLPYVRSARDGVAVYEVEYVPFSDGYLVLDGWVANTHQRSSR